MTRFLVLFAREPAREARAKGFGSASAYDSGPDSGSAANLFAGFAAGWRSAAERAGGRLVVATPPEDLAAWRRRFAGAGEKGEEGEEIVWLRQSGGSFGERLRGAARHEQLAGGSVVFVGGDVPPDANAALRAFEALEAGADAVLSPAPDGGVSLLALAAPDHDLLARIAAGSRDVFRSLSEALTARGRRWIALAPVADVDCRRDVRRLLRGRLAAAHRSALRSVLAERRFFCDSISRSPRALLLFGPSGLRAPPAAA